MNENNNNKKKPQQKWSLTLKSCHLLCPNIKLFSEIQMKILLSIFFLGGVLGQMRSTWPPWARPGINCLEYDGSKVPDCKQFVDPTIREPYYHPHSSSMHLYKIKKN